MDALDDTDSSSDAAACVMFRGRSLQSSCCIVVDLSWSMPRILPLLLRLLLLLPFFFAALFLFSLFLCRLSFLRSLASIISTQNGICSICLTSAVICTGNESCLATNSDDALLLSSINSQNIPSCSSLKKCTSKSNVQNGSQYCISTRIISSLALTPRRRCILPASVSPTTARKTRDRSGCCQAHSNCSAVILSGNPWRTRTNVHGRPARLVRRAPPFLRMPLC
mmetsp:Transcript_8650/g.18249  ORF Transcript_8650/g.18249 Transcript_8650/m.18249 type:complete len:224 (-) Transcript_8650:357-1028(-)